jgi:hypothetical protein
MEEQVTKKKLKTLSRAEKEEKNAAKRSWKVRLYPAEEERNRLNQWMGIFLWTY